MTFPGEEEQNQGWEEEQDWEQMMGAGGGGGADQQQDQGSSYPPSLFTCNREDSITPATVFVNPNEIHQYKPEQGDQDPDQLQQNQQVQEHQATQYYQLTQAQGHRQHVQGYHQQQPGQGHQQLHLQGVDQQDDVVDSRGESFASLGHIQFTIIESSNPPRRGSVEDQVIYPNTFPLSDSSDLVEDNSNSSHSFVYMDQGHQQNIQGLQQGVRGGLESDQGNSQMKVDIVPTKSEYIWPDETPYMTTGNEPSPTGLDVSTKDFAGIFQFQMKYIQPTSSSNSKWEYSKLLSKLYIDMNTWLQIEFYIGDRPPPGLIIRALPVFCEPAHIREPVRRCPAHRSLEDPVNVGFEHSLDHIIRIQGEDDIIYDEDATSKRLSTFFLTGQPHKGTAVCNRMIKFMCLGSDVGGMARKPIKVIFTLELQGSVVGRNVVDVRICSCPKRDLNQEEAKYIRTREKTRELADKFARNVEPPILNPRSGLHPPPGKRLKMIKRDTATVVMVPVHAEDYSKLNEFAEAAWIVRDPGNADTIRERRSNLLRTHNKELMRELEKKQQKKP